MSPVQTDDIYDAVVKGWECQETDRGVPFYIHNKDGRTDWDHPYYTKVIEELDAFQDVHYAAYRTALKLRHLQKRFGLHMLSLQCLQSVLQDHGFPQGCTGFMDSQTLQLVLLDIFHAPDFRHFDTLGQDIASELLHNYLLNLFDTARCGVLSVLSVKLALAALSNSNLSEKYQYFFGEIRSSRTLIGRDQLSTFIGSLIQIPDLLRESVAFGKNVAAAVESCVQVAGTLGDGIAEKGFYAWLTREPQTLIWLHTLHRLITAETVKHECRCSVCKAMPITGFRYKCLQCFKFNICQDCFFHARVSKNHQVRHPIQEYCLPVTAKDETKVFLKVVRNKISRRNHRTNKMAFLPVDSSVDHGLLEWEMRAVPTPPSPPASHEEDVLAVQGEVASEDSGHNSDHGGEVTSEKSPAPPSPSPGSTYDNSNSPARYLEEQRQPKRAPGTLQDRHSLIHLVHRLRKENRLLRQQLRMGLCDSGNAQETWRSCATAEVIAECSSSQSSSGSPTQSRQSSPEIQLPDATKNDETVLAQTVSQIGEITTTSDQQRYNSDCFMSILGTTTPTVPDLDVTVQGLESAGDIIFSSTPATSTAAVLKSGPRKPPRLTGNGDKNISAIGHVDAGDRMMKAEVLHEVQVHRTPLLDEAPLDKAVDKVPIEMEVSMDEIWADSTPCTIRKRVVKCTHLANDQRRFGSCGIIKTPDFKTRRKSTGSLITASESRISSEHTSGISESSKHYSSLNRLGFRSPGVDKSLFTVSNGDSVLKTPERQEIDKMIQWIDMAFPPDLSYSALSLCPDQSAMQRNMLQAAESIGHAMADLVQATADNCRM